MEDEIGRDRIGRLKSDIAKVKREDIVQAAEKLMALHASSKATLEVQFVGEDGFGSGVTQNFYCAVGAELQTRAENSRVPLWMPDEAGAEGFLSCPAGLYPQPLSPTAACRNRVCQRLRMLGQLLAKAARDGFIVPLPLSDAFFRLVKRDQPCSAILPPVGATGGIVSAYAAVCNRAEAIESNSLLSASERESKCAAIMNGEFARQFLGADYDMTLPEYLSSADACFVDPVSGAHLCEHGEARKLTTDTLKEYVALVVEAWLGESVEAQVTAFREGLADVFPFEQLDRFSGSELKYMFCGNNTIDWDSATLEQHLQPVASLTRESPSFQLLVEQLLEMTNQERSDFLNFVTACPRLPPGGLGALGIEVTTQRTQSMIPTSQTCVPKLFLPEYVDGEALRAGMIEAFKNAAAKEGIGFHERAMYMGIH